MPAKPTPFAAPRILIAKTLPLLASLLLAFSLTAAAQTPKQTPKGKPPAAAMPGQPVSSDLTAAECRKLGGTTSVDDTGTCKLRMRCTIIHGSGDVNSLCIDEAE